MILETIFVELGPTPMPTLRDYRTLVHELLAHQHDLLSEMLDAAQLQHGTLTMAVAPLDLALLTSQILRQMQPRFERQYCAVTLSIAPATAAPHPSTLVLGDSQRLGRVLRNILINAITYAVKAQPDAARVQVTVEHDEREVRCWVQDNGAGINESVRERLGQRFVSTNGTGIGLSLCYQILQAHPGGRFAIGPAPTDSGTVVLIALPRLTEQE